MSTPSQQTRLAELLEQLHLSQAELARRSHTSITTTARVVHGEQASAAVRARIVEAIHQRRAKWLPPKLGVSDACRLVWMPGT